jgi:N-acetylglutamate synthase-like GNAT family acetyltransferase
MLLEHVPDAPAAPVREGTPDEIQALMRRWLDEDDQTAQALDQLLERTAREHAARRERLIVAEHEGRAAAMCTVRFGEGVAQLEDVYALPHARGTGLGHAVTATAARVAADSGAEVVFIVADDRGWPKELYAKIGFAPLARRAQLHRAPAGG